MQKVETRGISHSYQRPTEISPLIQKPVTKTLTCWDRFMSMCSSFRASDEMMELWMAPMFGEKEGGEVRKVSESSPSSSLSKSTSSYGIGGYDTTSSQDSDTY